VLGVSYRAGVKESAFSGVFAVVAALQDRGADPAVHDPLYSDGELVGMGLSPYHLGEPADAVVVHTDHALYRTIGARDFPGVRAVVDGRRATDPTLWDAVARRVIGDGRTRPHSSM